MKRSKVAQRSETNERIKLFEHSQAPSVCLKADYICDFTGMFQNGTIKNSSIWIYHGEPYFLQIHERNMGGRHARFGAIMVQLYGKGKYSLQNASFQCAR